MNYRFDEARVGGMGKDEKELLQRQRSYARKMGKRHSRRPDLDPERYLFLVTWQKGLVWEALDRGMIPVYLGTAQI